MAGASGAIYTLLSILMVALPDINILQVMHPDINILDGLISISFPLLTMNTCSGEEAFSCLLFLDVAGLGATAFLGVQTGIAHGIHLSGLALGWFYVHYGHGLVQEYQKVVVREWGVLKTLTAS